MVYYSQAGIMTMILNCLEATTKIIKKTPEEYERQSKILHAFKQACLQFQFKCAVNQEILVTHERQRDDLLFDEFAASSLSLKSKL